MSKATERWLAKLEWHFDRLEQLKDHPNPQIQHLRAIHIPLYKQYKEQFERTGKIDLAMYEMVMGNM